MDSNLKNKVILDFQEKRAKHRQIKTMDTPCSEMVVSEAAQRKENWIYVHG